MDDGGRIVLGPAARELRRALRPIEWVVLEDVALDARRDDTGALVAPTSARRVAEHLGLTPGAVARALARLRSAGFVTHARQAGPAGRFGLSAYVLGAVPGLEVLAAAPEGEGPCPVPPHVDRPRSVDADMVGAQAAGGEAPDVGGSARRSINDDVARALAAAVDDLASKESARSSRRRSPEVPTASGLPVGHHPAQHPRRHRRFRARPEPGSTAMTATTEHHLQPTTATTPNHHPADHDHRTSNPSAPTTPTPTDTCHVFDEAAGPSAASPC